MRGGGGGISGRVEEEVAKAGRCIFLSAWNTLWFCPLSGVHSRRSTAVEST